MIADVVRRVAVRDLPEDFALIQADRGDAAVRRLRDRQAHFAIYSILTTGAEDLEADFLTHIAMVPVVAADHPLAGELAPLSREVLEQHIQLVVTDRSSLTPNLRGGIYSMRIWRFADLSTRLDYLLGGFGWCHMPWQIFPLPFPPLAVKPAQPSRGGFKGPGG